MCVPEPEVEKKSVGRFLILWAPLLWVRFWLWRLTIHYQMYDLRISDESPCRETTESLQPLTMTSDCQLSLRHFLTTDREEVLHMSMENLRDNCPERIQYPQKAILSPILTMFYNRSQLEISYTNGISAIRERREAHKTRNRPTDFFSISSSGTHIER